MTVVAASAAPARFVSGQILVKPRGEVTDVEFEKVLGRQGSQQRYALHRSKVRVVRVNEANADAVLASLRRDPTIEFAERDFVAEAAALPNDTFVANGSEWHLGRIQAPLAWNFTTGASNVVVAVLDSGVNAAHPDLAPNLLPGYDFVWNDNDPSDDYGHGTAVAGVIAAAGNNGIGVAGVAYGCKILPVKVMDASGFAAYSAVAQGIRYAVDNGARVINISIAGNSPSATLQDAINYAWSNNVVVIAAAGNNSSDAPQYPAACEHVVAVSATEPDDSLAWFSSYGTNVVLAAPGDSIWTTQRDAANPYGAWRGTSLASPIVAGAAALVASANASLTATQIVSVLEQSADDLGVLGFDSSFGFGRVNVARAVALAAGVTLEVTNAPPPPPLVRVTNPTNNAQILLGSTVTVTVNAAAGSTNTSLTNVVVLVNGVPLVGLAAPPFTTTWRPSVVGSFSIIATASDNFGQQTTSAPVSVRVFTNPPTSATLSLQTTGNGKVLPNLNGQVLAVGKTFTVRALPGPGQVFAGWDGVASANPSLTFTMQPGLALVAKFVPSPFVSAKGRYTGLVWNPNGVLPESSGTFSLTLANLGEFTGALTIRDARLPFTGVFNLNGDASVTISRGTNSPLSMPLHVDLTSASDQVWGSVSDGRWTSSLAGDRNVFSASSNPAPQAGQWSFNLAATETRSNAVATGVSRISAAGAASVTGTLGDGRRFAASNPLAKNGSYPFYLSLNKGNEVVIGWLNFPANPAPTASGSVVWVRTGTNGFAATLQATSVLQSSTTSPNYRVPSAELEKRPFTRYIQ